MNLKASLLWQKVLAHAHVCVHSPTCTQACAYSSTCAHAYTYSCACAHVVHTHAYMYEHIHLYTNTYVHIQWHAHICGYIHPHAHIPMHIHPTCAHKCAYFSIAQVHIWGISIIITEQGVGCKWKRASVHYPWKSLSINAAVAEDN